MRRALCHRLPRRESPRAQGASLALQVRGGWRCHEGSCSSARARHPGRAAGGPAAGVGTRVRGGLVVNLALSWQSTSDRDVTIHSVSAAKCHGPQFGNLSVESRNHRPRLSVAATPEPPHGAHARWFHDGNTRRAGPPPSRLLGPGSGSRQPQPRARSGLRTAFTRVSPPRPQACLQAGLLRPTDSCYFCRAVLLPPQPE